MSAKPIFTIGLPVEADMQAIEHVRKDLDKKLGDEYHVLVYRAQEVTGVVFNVLNATNATNIEIQELIDKTDAFIKSAISEKNNIKKYE